MREKFLHGVILAGALAMVYAFTVAPRLAHAGDPTNLKVFPKNTTKAEIKKAMKSIAEGLGVQCDHCHDLDDMAKDTEKKEVARGMMLMVSETNTKYFKGKPRVRCLTCHNGQKKPK
jgi:hypothetical protein